MDHSASGAPGAMGDNEAAAPRRPRSFPGAGTDDDAAVVSPAVVAQRKRRAAKEPPAVTPHESAAFFGHDRDGKLDDLRKSMRRRSVPADQRSPPPEESRTVRRALAARRASRVDALSAECACRLAQATSHEGGNPFGTYARLEEALSNLRGALQDASQAVEAEEAAIEGEARTWNEVEADVRACTARLLAGDATVEKTLEALDVEFDNHASRQIKDAERLELWDLREAPANALALARTRRLVPRVTSVSLKTLRRLYASALPSHLDASKKLARRIFNTPALALVHCTDKELRGTHEADLRRKCDASQLDVVELRAVYAAVQKCAWRNPRGAPDGRAQWRAEARNRLVALVGRERRGALKPHEARRPEYAAFDAARVDLDAVCVVDVADLEDHASFDSLSGSFTT